MLQEVVHNSPHADCLATTSLPRLDLVKCTQHQVTQAISPVFNIGSLVDHVILAPLFVGDVAKCLNGVLAAWMHQHLDVTVSCANQPVGAVNLVLHSPWVLRANDFVAVLPDNAVVSFASSADVLRAEPVGSG